ncbi:MAG: response regulator transcription factor [Burkholderiales bacterium]|nr:response regulator transcription factor [Burkholderiales bacterium]
MKILLADDHALIRSGLRNELAEVDAAAEFVEAWDVASLCASFEAHGDLDLAIVDLTMPGMNGGATIADLRQRFSTVPLVVLSAADAAEGARMVLRAGAAGFIPKTAMSKVMLQAIRLVLAGGRYLPPELLHLIDRQDTAAAEEIPPSAALPAADARRRALLSERQREVFDLLAQGLSNKMIARRLGVTEGTVKSHVAAIFDVLDVHNRVSAVAAARAAGGDDRSR